MDRDNKMTQAYIHVCERADLLGLPIPTEEEWKEQQKLEALNHVSDEDNDVITNLDSSAETAQRISGGLDELNSILSSTQKKINRFQTVCGSLATLLRIKVGSKNSTPDYKPFKQSHNNTKDIDSQTSTNEENLTVEISNDKKSMENTETNTTMQKKYDINKKMGSHLDTLDSLITKAENAQYSMQYQTKQMKKFIK